MITPRPRSGVKRSATGIDPPAPCAGLPLGFLEGPKPLDRLRRARFEDGAGQSQVAAGCDFQVGEIRYHNRNGVAGALDDLGIVGDVLVAVAELSVGVNEDLPSKHLWGLGLVEGVAGHGLVDHP